MRFETIGRTILYLGDCMELMKTFADGEFDLAIVDPPYGNCGDKRTWHFDNRGCFRQIYKKEHPEWISKNDKSHNLLKRYLPKEPLWDVAPPPEYFTELLRVSKKAIIWGGNYFALPPQRNFIIWRKTNMSMNWSMGMAEYAWTNIRGVSKVFEYSSSDPKRFHPTQKPVALYKDLLIRYAESGWRILDTHFGSGTLAVACNELGFDMVGCEINERYYNEAVSRVRKALEQGILL